MYSITKKFSFEAAHMLGFHDGECSNLHGHSYRLEVTVSSANVDKNGMILDFADLKKFVNDFVIAKLDHAFLYNKNSADIIEVQVAKLLGNSGKKTYAFENNATAENMAKAIFDILSGKINCCDFTLKSVVVYETEKSYAKYEA